jgi:hypothetical protein
MPRSLTRVKQFTMHFHCVPSVFKKWRECIKNWYSILPFSLSVWTQMHFGWARSKLHIISAPIYFTCLVCMSHWRVFFFLLHNAFRQYKKHIYVLTVKSLMFFCIWVFYKTGADYPLLIKLYWKKQKVITQPKQEKRIKLYKGLKPLL